jgi:tritrans,polycis-undecaprenyl-diphosphate synthase [geranylgeranyl-diphosphate specific]
MSNVPNHVGIILDGNRRFAKRLMLEPWKGHEYGEQKVEQLLDWCRELNIKKITLYVFSLENFNRPKQEFDYIMKIFRESFDRLKNDTRLDKYKIRINVIGKIELFPKDIQEKIHYIMEKTKNNDKYLLNFALGYSGRAEIVDATKKIIQNKLKPEEINEGTFAKYLYDQDDVDLIIRTSGEKRTSGFLLWQGSYAEFVFVDKFWPEFSKQDFIDALEEYSRRNRRLGI